MTKKLERSMTSLKYYTNADTAENYDKERFSTEAGKRMNAAELDFVLSNIPIGVPNPVFLDGGAGSGRFAIALAERGYHTVACDFSGAMLDVMKSKVKDRNLNDWIDMTRQDIRDLAFTDCAFDYVCSIRVTINLDTEESVSRALRELVRVCRTGGRIAIDFVNPTSLAALGPRKKSMIRVTKAESLLNSIPGVIIKKVSGRRIFSQTAFGLCPKPLLGFLDSLDRRLSNAFPTFCVRVYFVIEKSRVIR